MTSFFTFDFIYFSLEFLALFFLLALIKKESLNWTDAVFWCGLLIYLFIGIERIDVAVDILSHGLGAVS